MSIVDLVSSNAEGVLEMKNFASSMAQSLYESSRIVHISGELGAGKTTFVQGLAQGLGIIENATSPTYALEQRYDEKLSHIDLYRLSENEARDFMMTLDDYPGIRIIEWPEKARLANGDITVRLEDEGHGRSIEISCNDIAIPSDDLISSWYQETMIPKHIVKHMRSVATMCELIGNALQKQKRFLRVKALRAAALCHDLLRFTDFPSFDTTSEYSVQEDQRKTWQSLKNKFGTPHELAAERFLTERGFPEIGAIVRTHRGQNSEKKNLPKTIEQIALMYADKRSLHDKRVTIDERFDDLAVRYRGGKETSESNEWRQNVMKAETFLFPSGLPSSLQ
jgi:tRNA threonylcarbamoyladenosine biosynthesis protein TsaE